MKLSLSIFFTCLLCDVASAQSRQAILQTLETAPLRFEPSTDGPAARFVARGLHHRFEFSRDTAVIHSAGLNAGLRFEATAPQARIDGEEELRSTTNLFLGSDPAKWRRAIPNYGRVRVQSLYRGIDLVYYGNSGELEYDLQLKPGADPNQIRLRLEGDAVSLDPGGNLVAGLIQKRPVAYQTAEDGTRTPVVSSYRRNRDGSYGFALGSYDRRRELVIDPVLTLSIYVGGTQQDVINAITHDSAGFLYVAGYTDSADFPLVGNASQATYGNNTDVFVAKIDPNHQDIVYSTYIGGSGNESLGGLAVDAKGNIYVGGTTSSSDLPTVNPYQAALGTSAISNVFLAWINPSGTLNYCSYLGGTGTDVAGNIALDSKGKVWMIGSTSSTDFPLLNPTQKGLFALQDMFIAGFNPDQSASSTLVYSTYLGGEGYDIGHGIAIAPDGTLWIAGTTYSREIEISGFSYHPTYIGQGDGYVAHIDPTLGSKGVLYATYLGGSGEDQATNIVVDSKGRAIVTGYTLFSNFPVTSDAMQSTYGGDTDVFISIIDTANPSSRSAELVYSTFFGGVNGDAPYDLKADANGILYLTGYTLSPGLPTTSMALQPAWDKSLDAFILKLDPTIAGTAGIDYLSYLGSDGVQVGYGIDFNKSGTIFVAGSTSGPIFDALGGVPKKTDPGNVDGFVAGFDPATFTTSIQSYQFPERGGSVTVAVRDMAGSGGTWSARSVLDWVTVTPEGGVGNGSVTITAAPNRTRAAQEGIINIAGMPFQVTQEHVLIAQPGETPPKPDHR